MYAALALSGDPRALRQRGVSQSTAPGFAPQRLEVPLAHRREPRSTSHHTRTPHTLAAAMQAPLHRVVQDPTIIMPRARSCTSAAAAGAATAAKQLQRLLRFRALDGIVAHGGYNVVPTADVGCRALCGRRTLRCPRANFDVALVPPLRRHDADDSSRRIEVTSVTRLQAVIDARKLVAVGITDFPSFCHLLAGAGYHQGRATGKPCVRRRFQLATAVAAPPPVVVEAHAGVGTRARRGVEAAAAAPIAAAAGSGTSTAAATPAAGTRGNAARGRAQAAQAAVSGATSGTGAGATPVKPQPTPPGDHGPAAAEATCSAVVDAATTLLPRSAIECTGAADEGAATVPAGVATITDGTAAESVVAMAPTLSDATVDATTVAAEPLASDSMAAVSGMPAAAEGSTTMAAPTAGVVAAAGTTEASAQLAAAATGASTPVNATTDATAAASVASANEAPAAATSGGAAAAASGAMQPATDSHSGRKRKRVTFAHDTKDQPASSANDEVDADGAASSGRARKVAKREDGEDVSTAAATPQQQQQQQDSAAEWHPGFTDAEFDAAWCVVP